VSRAKASGARVEEPVRAQGFLYTLSVKLLYQLQGIPHANPWSPIEEKMNAVEFKEF